MKEISREDLQRFPTGVHVVEVIPGEGQCSLYEHFPGVNCAQLADLRDFAHEHAKDEPVVVHCLGGVDCHLATALLECAGFDHVYHYAGDLSDLRPFAWRAAIKEEPALPSEVGRPVEGPRVEAAPPERERWDYYGTSGEPDPLPGYAEPFRGVEADLIRDPDKLLWSTIRPEAVSGKREAGWAHLPPWVGFGRLEEATNVFEGEDVFVELSEAAYREQLLREPGRRARHIAPTRRGRPPVIGPDQLSDVIYRAPRGHALLLEVTPPERCAYKDYVLCLPVEEIDRLPEIVGERDVVVFHARNEEQADAAYESLKDTPASAIYRLEGDFEDWLPGA